MTDSAHPLQSLDAKVTVGKISFIRRVAIIFFRVISLVFSLIALLAIKKFLVGAYAVIFLPAEMLEIPTEAIGAIYGEFVDGPLFLSIVFAGLALKLWRAAKQMKVHVVESNRSQLNNWRDKILKGVLKVLIFTCGVSSVLFVTNFVLAALMISFVNSDHFGHTLFKFDYMHEIFFWLPATLAAIFVAMTFGFVRLQRVFCDSEKMKAL